MNLPFTQTKEYLSWHEAVGHKTFYKEFYEYENIDSGEEIEFQISDLGDREKEIEKKKKVLAICASVIIETRVGNILYVPYGPALISPFDKGGLRGVLSIEDEIQNYLYNLAKKENCFFVRFENFIHGDKMEKNFSLAGQFYGRNFSPFLSPGKSVFQAPIKTFAKEGIFQPRVEWWLDLAESEENIYNNFHKDHRYSIRRAEKENIQVEIVSENLENYFSIFWQLLSTTSERDEFSLYSENYYKQILTLGKAGELEKFLVFTKIQGEYVSAALIVISGEVANLVFAGSQNEKRELGFNHLMQWEAIKESKKRGCKIYNFGGITDGVYGKNGLVGVTKFKQRFGGYKKFHGNFVDLPVKKFLYFLYIFRKML